MKLAIVILNYNGTEILPKFLPSVVKHTPLDIPVYLIDNSSTDVSLDYVKTNFSTVKCIGLEENYGFAKGYNEGLKEIEAEAYCLLNSDVEVTENWTQSVLQRFMSNSSIAAIQPKIKDYKQKDCFEYAGAAGGYWDNLGYPFCDGRLFWSLEKDKGQYDVAKKIGWASGACMFVKATDFWGIGGFDEDFFAHQEEIDLCWRLQNAGKEVWYEPNATVYHLGGGTLKVNNPRKTYLNFRNNLCVLAKNMPLYYFALILVPRLLLDGVSAFVFWKYNGFSHFTAVMKAHFAFYGLLPKMLGKRGGKAKLRNKDTFLVFKYFLRRLNTK